MYVLTWCGNLLLGAELSDLQYDSKLGRGSVILALGHNKSCTTSIYKVYSLLTYIEIHCFIISYMSR